jgi:hypothetical protein
MSGKADLQAFAFVDEHTRCGQLHTGTDNGYVWMDCSGSVLIMHSVSGLPTVPVSRRL